MSASLREQINLNIVETEHKLQSLLAASQTDSHRIEGERRELKILQRKLKALPQDETRMMYA